MRDHITLTEIKMAKDQHYRMFGLPPRRIFISLDLLEELLVEAGSLMPYWKTTSAGEQSIEGIPFYRIIEKGVFELI